MAYETTISNALTSAGVPSEYLTAEPREDLLKGAYLYGKTGRGKTYAACGAIKSFAMKHIIQVEGVWLYHGSRAKFVNTPAWFWAMKNTYNGGSESEQQVFDRYAKCKLLVLDDLGKGSRTEWAAERLYLLLDYRCNEGLPTIITSNYGLAQVASMLATDEDTMQAIASRVLKTCAGNGIEVKGKDLRRIQKNDQDSQLRRE